MAASLSDPYGETGVSRSAGVLEFFGAKYR